MTKEELKRLKRKLETKVVIEDAFGGSGVLSLYEVEQRINTIGAIQNIENYFENVIKYFSSKGIKYDEIKLKPLFSLIIREKDVDEHTIIKSNANPIPKLVVVKINGFYCSLNDERFDDDPDIIYPANSDEYVVVFDDFIKLLSAKGFGYNGSDNMEDIKQQIISGAPTLGDITLSFKKNKVRTRA